MQRRSGEIMQRKTLEQKVNDLMNMDGTVPSIVEETASLFCMDFCKYGETIEMEEDGNGYCKIQRELGNCPFDKLV